MLDLETDCELNLLTKNNQIQDFDCGISDLNEFFVRDAILYSQSLLGETYFFRQISDPQKIACAFSLSNDAIKVYDLPNSRRKKIQQIVPREKRLKTFPATLIGRIGVAKPFQRHGTGSQLMTFIKSYCLEDPGNRARFLVVDAYNNENAIKYYKKNEFKFLFTSEDQEKEYYKRNSEAEITTRIMYFDLMAWKQVEI